MPSVDSIASAADSSSAKVSRYWPTILAALRAEGLDSEATQIAAAATLRAEVGANFAPVSERSPAGVDAATYFEGKYGPTTRVGQVLGNTEPGDGYRFRGRGFIQLTGRDNYRHYGERIGVDLLGNPDAALSTYNAARVFAAYFKDRGVGVAADSGDWVNVRKLVNGGLNGWEEFKAVVARLTPSVTGDTGGASTNILPGPKASGIIAVLVGGFLLALLAARRIA